MTSLFHKRSILVCLHENARSAFWELWDQFFFFLNIISSSQKPKPQNDIKTFADTPKHVFAWTGPKRHIRTTDQNFLQFTRQADFVSPIKDAVTRCCRGGKKRRHKEQWQLKKKDVAAFGYQCVDLCEGQWRQLHSHSPLRAKVKNTAICHYTKPELYLARAILRKLWRFILQGLIMGQSYLTFLTWGKITHVLYSHLGLNSCLNAVDV